MFASLGGALADSSDKRYLMIILDLLGMIVVLLYIPIIYYYKSLGMLYWIIFIQSTIAAIYEPICNSIVPLLVPKDDELKKATTLSTLSWSSMQSIGTLTGGIIVSKLGMKACFLMDSITYLLSAILMYLVG